MIIRLISKLLKDKKLTISTAESCTGGLLSGKLTSLSGSSAFFKAGFICYSNQSKVQLLKVKPATLRKYGAVSSQVGKQMAQGTRKILKTDLALSITGIAGPEGATLTKPVGLVYIGLDSPDRTVCRRFIFKGNRSQIRNQAALKALEILKQCLK